MICYYYKDEGGVNMPRKPRVQDTGMIHHVIVRGNNSQDIFLEDNDYIRYLHILHRYKNRFKFKILTYCMMKNHIHLLLKQSEIDLSKFMAGLQQSYTQYFNCKYNETGHVFEQRFKSFPCSDEAYYLSLIAYINNNPKKAGLVKDAHEYRWSSHNEIMNPKDDNLCDVDELFEQIGRNNRNPTTEYLWLLGEADDIELQTHYMESEELEISESSAWLSEIEKMKNRRNLSIDEIHNLISSIEFELFFKLKLSDYRKIFTIIASNHSMLKIKEIADYLEIHPSRVSKIKNEYLDDNSNNYINVVINKIIKLI